MSEKWREKDGRLIHDGDCYFWGTDICTCGLLHCLMPNPPSAEWFYTELARQDIQLERVPKPLPYVKPTEEELKKRQKFLEELFPGIDIDLTKPRKP